MTVREAYNEAKRRLLKAGIENPAFEAACLLEKHTGIKRHEIIMGPDAKVPELCMFWHDIDRRVNQEPLQYILGEWEFMGLQFKVGEGVLIPRPETELLAQTAIDFLKDKEKSKVLELCAGSGCISVSIAIKNLNCEVKAVELSDAALFYLNKNIEKYGLAERVSAVKADALTYNNGNENGCFDVLVCNPPYIKTDDIDTLDRNVKDYEPHLALDGGEDGFDFYRKIPEWKSLLNPGGMAAFEVGIGQAQKVAEIMEKAGFERVFIKKDYAGIERVVGGYVK